MAERRRIIEGTWRCTSCGATGILGRHKTCPSCGNPRESKGAESEFDFGPTTASGASSRAEVQDAQVLEVAHAGEDWFCAYCGTANRGDVSVCRSCSAEREAPPAARAAAVAQPVASLPMAASPRSGRWRLALGGCGCLTLVLVLLVGVGFWSTRTHEYRGRVVQRTWQREIVRERFTPVTREGWREELNVSQPVMPVAGHGERGGVTRVRDCSSRQKGTRRVADGTERVCHDRTRRVACGKEERCRRKDLGNGFAEEVCDDVTKYCDEHYQDCGNETRYREEPVFAQHCRYDTWEWRPAGRADASGRDDTPRWPPIEIGAQDRASRKESYQVVVEYDSSGRKKQLTHPLGSEAELARWRSGQDVVLTISNAGALKGVRPTQAGGQ
jgi:hypothetical protein